MKVIAVFSLLCVVACGDKEGPDVAPPEGEDTSVVPETDDTGTPAAGDDRTESGAALCGGGGTASDGTHTAVACLAPAEVALTTEATDGTHTLQIGAIHRIAP